MIKRRPIWIFLLSISIVCLFVLPLWRIRTEVYRDARVIVGEKRTLRNYLSAHASPQKYLIVYDKEFLGVRGMPPCYLEVKPLGAILFVTEDTAKQVTIILAFDGPRTTVQVPAGKSGFGWNIGSKRPDGESLTDWVESADSKRVVLSRRGLGWKESTILNLEDKTVEEIRSDYDGARKP